MSWRTAITYICDRCSLCVTYEMQASGFHEQIASLSNYPRGWTRRKLEGGSDIGPGRDYCPDCWEIERSRTSKGRA